MDALKIVRVRKALNLKREIVNVRFMPYQKEYDLSETKKKRVNILVIGNGDVFCGKDALDMMRHTGCNMVMIARGALGNPWIFKEADDGGRYINHRF